MTLPLRVLILEDHPSDAELIVYELIRAGYEPEWHRADGEASYRSYLQPELDLIIADFVLPQFDAMRALELLKERSLDIPFIVVTGSISEETAVKTMQLGAADYLLKDRLARLGQAVANALEQKRARDERRAAQLALRESEERFRRLAENAQDIIYRYHVVPEPGFDYVSPAVVAITGYTPADFYANPNIMFQITWPEDRLKLERALREGTPNGAITLRMRRRDNKMVWIEQRNVPVFDDTGNLITVEGIARDVTDRILRQSELETMVTLSAAMRTAPDRASLMEIILDQVLSMLHADSLAIILKDAHTGEGVVELARGQIQRLVGMRVPPGEGIIGQVLKTGQLYLTQDLSRDRLAFHPELFPEVRAAACAPLASRDQVIGAMMLARETALDAYEARLLSAVADLAANAIQRTTLHEETIHHARQMFTVSEIGQVLAESLDLAIIFKRLDQYLYELLPDICGVFISFHDIQQKVFTCAYASMDREPIDPDSLPPIPVGPPGRGTQSEVIHSRKPLIVNNLREYMKNTQVKIEIGSDKKISLSGLYVPMLARQQVIGVMQVQSYSLNRFDEEDAELLSLVASTAAVAIENARLLADLQRSNLDLVQAYTTTLEGWSRALDLRDHETEGHTQRVAGLAVGLAEKFGISGEELVHFQRGALLHDIGKMGIPDNILLKPGPLTPEEMTIMRLHPGYAFSLIHPITYLRPALDIPHYHHEKWDGSGYPHGLKGTEIPLAARIFAVIDVWDALCSDRPYRPAWSKEKAMDYIREQSGKHFDPQVIDAFIKMIAEGK